MKGRWGWLAVAAAALWWLTQRDNDMEEIFSPEDAAGAGIGPPARLVGLTATTLARLIRLKSLTDQAGLRWVIVSGYRSVAEQARLYDRYRSGQSDLPAAPPWRCTYHCTGRAVDIKLLRPDGSQYGTWDSDTPWALFGTMAEQAGFRWGGRWGQWGVRGSGWDPVHIEAD